MTDTPEQADAKAVKDLTADQAQEQLTALEAEVEAQSYIDIMKSQRMHELRRHIYFHRLRASIPAGATP